MQDIDFDEIDRAVNSVTNTNSNTAPEPVAFTPVTEPKVDVPSAQVEPENTSIPAAPVSSAPSPAARRSSGRFMDVVHPSSDMRPVVPERSSSPVATNPVRETIVEREEVVAQPESVAIPTSTSAFHWSDPVVESPLEPVVEVVPEPIAPPEPSGLSESPDSKEDSSPLESPFLTNAKVEKRPLGAFSGADADLPLIEDPIELSTQVHEETLDELHPDLLLLEDHDQDEPLLEATNPPDEIKEVVVTEPAVPTVTETTEPTGPTSITQQYKEQPSTTEVAGSIFDTEAYHQPLTHATSKRSGALVIVWIVALILFGGGIGAAVYFVLLPMLG